MAGAAKSTDILHGYTSKDSAKDTNNIGLHIFQLLEVVIFIFVSIIQIIYYIGENIYYMFNKKQPKSVKNDIVLITGSGHGIGKQLALQYAEQGTTVVCWDINKENNDQTVKEINALRANKAFGYTVDVTDADDVVNTAKLVESQIGQVTILVLNAGIMPCHPLLDHTRQEIRKIMDVNVMQLFWLMEAFLPTMIKNNRGHIVAMSSVAGLGGLPNLVPYCASKFAVRGLMEALHEELRTNRNNNIKLTSVFPYMVDTGLCKNPRIKFTTFMQMLKPEEVAREIIMAQRTDISEISLPGYFLPLCTFLRILPRKALLKCVDFLDSGIESDLQNNRVE